MEILNAAITWTRAELTSSLFFMLFGIIYITTSIGLWQLGNSQLTKALIIPMLIAGGLLLSAGISFYFSNKTRLTNLETEFNVNPTEMISAEITRTATTIKTYENVALKVFPAIVVLAILLAIIISNPIVRAISIAVAAFLSVLILLDSQALKRIKTYHQQLELVKQDF